MYKLTHILISGFYLFLPSILIFFQPDIGSAILLFIIWIGILIISGIKLDHFLILLGMTIFFIVLAWIFILEDYQKQRILAFVFPYLEPLGAGWQQKQAKIAIGSGGLFGRGIGRGEQVQLGFLPEAQTDFIFSAIGEEMGFLGVSFLIFSFIILFWRIIKIGLLAKDNFSRLFSAGFFISLLGQVIINIGMNLGILPVIGISLPFVSYGGSSLIMNFIGIGILNSFLIKTK
jgi:rod shape determining protein RodA